MIYTKHCSIKKDYLGKVVLDNKMLNAVTYVSEENKIYYRRNRPIDYFDVFDYRIEYIENFDTCYIDTGIKGSGSQKVECEFMPIQKTDGYNCVYGARTTAGKKDDGIYIYSNNSNNNVNRQYIAYNTSYAANITSTINVNTKYKIVQNKGTFILNGTVVKTYTDATFTCPTATIFIFDGNNNGTRGNYYGYFRLYLFKIWNDDVLVRDYIPVVKDNIAYLYDKVSGQLFGNASGSGGFGKGPILEEDKDRLVRIQYLESNGTQYIDTGIKASQYPFKLDIEFMNHTSSGEKDVWGNINTSQGDKYGFVSGVFDENFFQWGGSNWKISGATANQWHIVTYEYLNANTRNMIADGTSYTTNISNNNIILSDSNIYLFSDGPRGSMKFKGKIKYAKIYINNQLIRDYIPVRLKNRGYMFDRITGILYGGVGNFIFGPDIDIYDTEVEYLESTGTQYIDTDINYDFSKNIIIKGGVIPINNERTIIIGNFNNASACLNIEFGGTANSHQRQPRYYISLTKSSNMSDTWYTEQTLNNKFEFTATYNITSHEKTFTFLNNTSSITYNGTVYGTPKNLCLFLDLRSDPTLIANGLRITYIKIYLDDKLVRNFIPVRKGNTGYLYDKVTIQLFGNAGTGDFVLGPDV